MFDHHREAVDALVTDIEGSGRFQAAILTGSLAQGRARPDSDVDVYLVVTDDEHAERRARHDLAYHAPCDYQGGYVDGKIVSRAFLDAAAERGSEPTRASFRDSRVVFSALGDLQPLLDRIGRYPEENRDRNIADFFGHFILHAGYFLPSARQKGDPFLLHHSITHAAFYAGRLLLAHNRELFPCPKQLLDALGRCADLPVGFVSATTALLQHAEPTAVQDYVALLLGFTDWGVSQDEVLTRFMELDEWSWFDDCPGLAQR